MFISSIQINQPDHETVEDRDPGVPQRDDRKRFKCGDCDFTASRSWHLKRHSRKHTGEMFRCKLCDYTTVEAGYLRTHSRKHTGDLLQCNDFEYKTVHSNRLKAHTRKHTGE